MGRAIIAFVDREMAGVADASVDDSPVLAQLAREQLASREAELDIIDWHEGMFVRFFKAADAKIDLCSSFLLQIPDQLLHDRQHVAPPFPGDAMGIINQGNRPSLQFVLRGQRDLEALVLPGQHPPRPVEMFSPVGRCSPRV